MTARRPRGTSEEYGDDEEERGDGEEDGHRETIAEIGDERHVRVRLQGRESHDQRDDRQNLQISGFFVNF